MKLNIYRNRLQKEHFTTLSRNEIFTLIRTAKSDTPKNERLGVVYASTSTKGRKHEDIDTYTGMAFIDVDNCKKPKLVKLLFQELDCTIACWYSSSGNVHALIKKLLTGGKLMKLPATLHNLHSYQVMQKYILMKHQYLMRVSIYLHHHKL
jgi:hypothetical protein